MPSNRRPSWQTLRLAESSLRVGTLVDSSRSCHRGGPDLMPSFARKLSPQLRSFAPILAVCAVVAGGCASSQPKEHPIIKMAQFDLNCARKDLTYTQIDKNTWGVTGCGKRTKYVRLCRRVGEGLL